MIHYEKTEKDIRREAMRGKIEAGTRYSIIGLVIFFGAVFSFPFIVAWLFEVLG